MLKQALLLTLLATCSYCFEFDHLPVKKLNDNQIVCRNEITGEQLDWFTLYKLPKLTKSIDKSKKVKINPFINKGTAYTFMTNKDPKWKISDISMNDTNSFPGKTLESIYATDFSSKNANIGYIFYNDQADKVTLIRGHTKGIILFNDKSAVWIVHSIPHYPPKQSMKKYFISPSQCVYGQSMLCASFNFDQLELIGQQLLYNYPQIYDYFIPENLKLTHSRVLENLLSVINGNHIKQQPWSNVNLLTTTGGEKLLSFAKFTDFEEDLYSGLVAPNLKSNLLTETWNNGAGTLTSNCSAEIPYHVMNVEEVKFDFLNLRFSVHHDHSKWAVTSFKTDVNFFGLNFYLEQNKTESEFESDEVKIGCIGDINRQEEQFKRGGGTVCFVNNINVWEQYYNLINDFEHCKKFRVNKFKKRVFESSKTREKIVLLG